MLLSVIQEDQLDDGWSPVISDYDRVTNPKAFREALSIHKFSTSLNKTTRESTSHCHNTAPLSLGQV